MDNPEEIKTESTGVTAEGVSQSLYQPASDEKIPLLLGLLGALKPPRSIVFVNTKRAAEKIEGFLLGNDFACGTLSGDVRQSKRQRILADFTAGKLPVLIATDVAARGLHIDDVSHVFNYDLPQQAEDYVHRIGRTARAGTQGVAVSFACENYSFSLPEIQEYIGQSIPLEMITDELLIKPKPAKRVERDRVGAPAHGKKKHDPSRNRSKPRPKKTESKAPAPTAATENAKPKKRRRRRKPAGAAGQNTANGNSSNSDSSAGNTNKEEEIVFFAKSVASGGKSSRLRTAATARSSLILPDH
jgi:ATP-dependent RNA helicase RhlB